MYIISVADNMDLALLVKCLDQAHENPKQLEEWISSIEKLHQSRPTPTVHYARPMPDIESLMQEWPQEVLKQ